MKYGQRSFSLYILEYCDSKDTIEREQEKKSEQFYCLLKPTYNILSVAGSGSGSGSPLGRIHTEETKLNISKAMQQGLSQVVKTIPCLVEFSLKK